MLLEMDVRNYALIEHISIEFGDGFNVLTGETGAGKSLVIDCLGLAVGGRASAESVRTGAESAVVEAVFDLSQMASMADVLREQGVDPEPDGTLIVSREVWRQGRSRCRVNGRTVTLTSLAAIGEYLVDIYGQHEYQSLARPSRHLALLDSFGGAQLSEALAAYRANYGVWRSARRELAELAANARDRARRADLLAFEVSEIESAQLRPDEDVTLAAERTILANAERLLGGVSQAFELVYESSRPDSPSAYDMLADALAHLDAAARIDASLASVCDSLASMCEQAGSLGRAMRSYRESIDFSPQRLAAVEERLAAIARLKRKYGDNLAEVIEHGRAAREALDLVVHADERLAELEQRVAEYAGDAAGAAAEVSRIRGRIASRLEHDITCELAELSMPKAAFRIQIGRARGDAERELVVDGQPCIAGPDGVDEVEFLFSANPGEEPRPLSRIASGGEMSRVMLAIKSVLAQVDDMPTMVFDEVDQGIGGEASVAVAARLAGIGRVRQVLAVTHLPQIAAAASRHFAVRKEERGGRTQVGIWRLDSDERVAEVGRMLGGDNPSALTLAHAREMLEKLAAGRI